MATLTRTYNFYGNNRYMSIIVILVLTFLFLGVSAGIYVMLNRSADTDAEEEESEPEATGIAAELAKNAEHAQNNPAPEPTPTSTPEPKPAQDNGDTQAQAQSQSQSEPPKEDTPIVCSNGTKNVNGVCVPEVRYLSGFDYADCDQKYVWSTDLKAYVNAKKDRALVVKDHEVSCYPVNDGKIGHGNYGTRVLDVEVILGEHDPTDIPDGTERTLSGFRYANCDGHYRWSVALKAFVNDEHNRALIMDGTKLRCRKLEDGKITSRFGARTIGADGVSWT